MKLRGTATLTAPADQVWAALNDPAILVRTIPGCERLEAVGPDRYRMTVTAGVASIKGTYLGDVELCDHDPHRAFTLRAQGSGAPGTIRADVRITLDERPGGITVLDYAADAVVGGTIAGVGQRVLGGVSRKMAGEFFQAVNAALAGGTTDLAPAAESPAVPRPPAAPLAPGSPPTPTALTSPAGASPAGASGSTAGAPTVFTRPGTSAPATDDRGSHLTAALVGAGIALLGVVIGWLLSRKD